MKKIFLFIFCPIFIVSSALFATESNDELKAYLSDMNKIVIEVEETMRNLSMKILPAKNAAEQISTAVEKFKTLKSPLIFSKDHDNMLLSFKIIRDGLELLSMAEMDKARELVMSGAALLRDSGVSVRKIAEREGLIPARPETSETTKPILPSQTTSVIAGTSPTSSPPVFSTQIERDLVIEEVKASAGIKLKDIPDSASISTIPPGKPVTGQDPQSSLMLTATGEIASIEPRGDNFVIELEDASGNTLTIELNPQLSKISKDNKIVGASEINSGDSLYILYSKHSGRNQAIFISILKPEDVNALENLIESNPSNSPVFKKSAE